VRTFQGGNLGWIEVICGSMFSGKSEELIRRLRLARIARQRVQVFKPALDDRFGREEIVSHSEWRLPAELVVSAREIRDRVSSRTDVVGIDEAQFFDLDLVTVCEELANMGKRVIVAGLDQDFLGRPFEPVPQLMGVAEEVTKSLAICARCGNPANRTQRLTTSEERIVIGAGDVYEARCRRCFEPLPRERDLQLSTNEREPAELSRGRPQ
jgi:thymidine kinase